MKTKKCRVLYLNPASDIGGAERSLLGMLQNMDRFRFEPHVLLWKDGELRRHLESLSVPVHLILLPPALLRVGRKSSVFYLFRSFLTIFPLLMFYWKAFCLIRKNSFSIIHSNGLKTHFFSIPVRMLSSAKLIWHVREMVSFRGFYPVLWRCLKLGIPHKVIANSHAVKMDILSKGDPGRTEIQVIYNGIDTSRFFPVETNPHRDYIQLGIFSPLAPIKGFEPLFQVVAKLKARGQTIRLWVVGQSFYDTVGHQDYEDVLKQLARQLGLSHEVEFLGFQEDVADLMHQCDIVVQPSLQPEGFGRTVAETMACGVPVIAANRGGIPEIMEDGTHGFLIDPEDVEQFANAVENLIEQPELRAQMGRSGVERIREHFSLNSYVDQIQRTYETL